MSLPKQQKSIKTDGDNKASVHTDVPIPQLPEGWIMVKTKYVALNPTDWKHIKMAGPGHTVGCDFSGTVAAIGPNVTKPFQLGDRVAGVTHGVKSNNPECGAFGEYIITKGDLTMKLSSAVSDQEAATYGVGLITCGQGLYQSLGLPWPLDPPKEKTAVLIYGGSTATGIFGIQLAKLSGLTVVTTCSPRNFEFVKKLGADAAFDYKDVEACAKSIRDYTINSLMYAFDCISEGSSPEICGKALSSASGARYSAILPSGPKQIGREDLSVNNWTLGYTAMGEGFTFAGSEMPARPEDLEFAKKWMALMEKCSAERKFVVEPTMRTGGLDGIFSGLDDLREGRVSGQKLVYQIA